MKILKDIPIPPKHQFTYLLKMEIGDCVQLRQKIMSKKQEPFLARLWRVK
mgnify:CR=1 FL=1